MYSTSLGGGTDGMLAEYVSMREDGFVRIPDYMTLREARHAALRRRGTSWERAGHGRTSQARRFGAGDGDPGGVSIFALQFAAMYGARVIATSKQQTPS